MTHQTLLDDLGGNDSPRAVTAASMSNELCAELVETIDLGDWELNDWETEFIGGLLGSKHFSIKQKEVIYKLARRFRLL